jgi:hypothetical protein
MHIKFHLIDVSGNLLDAFSTPSLYIQFQGEFPIIGCHLSTLGRPAPCRPVSGRFSVSAANDGIASC